MAELISMTYEQARAEHFKAMKDKAERKMNYWAARVYRSRPNDLNDPAHIKASEYGAEYSYYNDALEALEAGKDMNVPTNQPKWISVENPPKEDGEYIVAAVTHEDKIVKAWDIFESNDGWCGDLGEFKKVLYYMPFESLPEPPKEEQE